MSISDFLKNLFNKNSTKCSEKRKINEELKEAIKKLSKNEIVLDFSENEVKEYSSKIGGKPFLPKDFNWPTYKSYEDNITRPLSFFCQINLEEVSKYDLDNLLPKSGMLYFFYECESMTWGFDPKDNGAARVFYYKETEGFISIDLPDDLENIIPELAIIFSNRNSYPMFEEFEYYDNLECDFEDYDNSLESLGVNLNEDGIHKLLGYANIIQNEMLSQCERVKRGLYCGDSESYGNTPQEVKEEIDKCAKEWILLFQLSTIETSDFEWMFGDSGNLYFYILKSDLENENFENIQFVVQCY